MTIEKPIASLSALRAWSFGFIKCCRKDLPQPVYDENGQAWRGVTDESYVGRLPEYDRTENIENQEPVENTRRVVKNASPFLSSHLNNSFRGENVTQVTSPEPDKKAFSVPSWDDPEGTRKSK